MSIHLTAAAVGDLDPGTFERVAMSMLRRTYPELSDASHVGINAEGKPIRGPHDAYLVRGGPEPILYLIYHTTSGSKRLKEKWFSRDQEHPGDLIVAATDAVAIRKNYPTARVRVFLTSNRVGNASLCQLLDSFATEHGLEVTPIFQDRIVDFLDVSPDGQYIRRRYLGVAQDRLSGDLLRALGAASIRAHARRFFIASPHDYTKRSFDSQIDAANSSFGENILPLVGQSGFGKSASTQAALRRHREDGGYALWIPEEIAAAEPFLLNAINETLRKHAPNLNNEAGADALRLAEESGRPFLVLIEDINQNSSPTALLEKIITWRRKDEKPASDTPLRGGYVILVPVWPAIWGSLADRLPRQALPATISIGLMNDAEALEVATRRLRSLGVAIDETSAREIAELCGNDPFIISLLSNDEPLQQAREQRPVTSYINRNLARLQMQSSGPLHVDSKAALHATATVIITDRTLRPAISDIRATLKDQSLAIAALNDILRDGRLATSDGSQRVNFRHDRLRDSLIVDVLHDEIRRGGENIFDPFWSQQAGAVLVSDQPTDNILHEFSSRNPIALAYAFQLAGTNAALRTRIVRALSKAISDPSPVVDPYANNEIAFILAQTDDPSVLEVTSARENTFFLARFSQGDIRAAIRFGDYFLLEGARFSDTQDWIARAERNPSFRENLMAAVASDGLPDDQRRALLAVCTRLSAPAFVEVVKAAYGKADEQANLLPDAMAALLRTPDCSEDALTPLLNAIMALPERVEEKPGIIDSPRFMEADETSRHIYTVSSAALAALRRFAGNDPERVRVVMHLIDGLDDPDSVELWLSLLPYSELMWIVSGNHFARRWDARYPDAIPMPRTLRQRLVQIWQDQSQNAVTRRGAIDIWGVVKQPDDTDYLQRIEENDSLYDRTVQQRLDRGDRSAIPVLVERLKQPNGEFWLRYCAPVWCPNLKDCVRELLQAHLDQSGNLGPNSYFFKSLLQEIPFADAEELLLHFAGELQSDDLCKAALYLGGRKLLDLAAKLVDAATDKKALLHGIDFYFGFKTLGLSERLTPEHLLRLEPYLTYLSQMDLYDLMEAASPLGLGKWAVERVSPLLESKYRSRLAPRLEDDFKELDEILNDVHGSSRSWYWAEQFSKRGSSSEEAVQVAKDWYHSRRTAKSFDLLLDLVRQYGGRNSLPFIRQEREERMGHVTTDHIEQVAFAVRRRSLQ